MLLGHVQASYLPPEPLRSCPHQATLETPEGWLRLPGWVILSTCFFSASLTTDACWQRLKWATKVFIFGSHSQVPIHVPLLLSSLLSVLLSFSFMDPIQLARPFTSSFSRDSGCLGTLSKTSPLQSLPCPLSVKAFIERGHTKVLSMFPWHHTHPHVDAYASINQAQAFSSSSSWWCGIPHMASNVSSWRAWGQHWWMPQGSGLLIYASFFYPVALFICNPKCTPSSFLWIIDWLTSSCDLGPLTAYRLSGRFWTHGLLVSKGWAFCLYH